ncbi:zinc finger protein 28-like isoform X1 [Papilio machaon]|uniref:zinc finger protein 28-like isoform X1 n=1 Tax=Papilio machaon TaxID=76193 RepID=UPI001E665CFE|nr:zinc finger protein 28-like isoform X1 [Papilio machaon]XP_045540866.1 zinc finger protein 28-like isoform X1 [Papilio machaon]
MDKYSLCRCCLAQPPDKQLKTTYTRLGKAEIYGDMLKECFEIHLPLGNSVDDGICDECVSRLCNAADFKKQVISCQKKFQTTLTKLNVKDEMDDTLVKLEYSDLEDGNNHFDYDFEEEFLDDELVKREEVLSKIISLEDVTIEKKIVKRNVKNLILEDCPNDSCRKISLENIKSSNKHVKFQFLNDKIKQINNLNNILKYSNCLPFSHKTIMGIGCAFCKNIYHDINELQTHYIEVHKNTNNNEYKKARKGEVTLKIDITDLKCTLCDNKIKYIKDLKKHLTIQHNIQFYPINDSIYEFKLKTTQLYNCVLCNSTYETFKTLHQHMNVHYRYYICKICDMGYMNQYSLKAHMKTHDIGTFKCDHCDKIFSTLVKKKFHEKYTHNKAIRYITNCPHCELSFTSYYQRNRHIFNEHNTSNYKCNVCDKTFILKSKLTTHIKKNHLMERDHICTVCGKGFFMKRLLNEHMITHNGERIFKCAMCNKAYARKRTLREHMRIHNNDRRFKCGLCSLAFVQKCSLKSHMLSNHGLTLAEFEDSQNGVTNL